MNICIKSEIDSRVVLYPLLQALRNYGSIAVLSSNKQVRRLIEDEELSVCRDITIIVDEKAGRDEMYEDNNFQEDKYDFIILDNIGSVDYDIMLIPLGAMSSEGFDEDVQLMIESEDSTKIYILQFGKSLKKAPKKESKPQKGNVIVSDDDYDPAQKFRDKQVDNSPIVKGQLFNLSYPTFESIEQMEGEHRFPSLDDSACKAFFTIFKDLIQSDSNNFRKVAQKKDEYSGYIKSRNSFGEE